MRYLELRDSPKEDTEREQEVQPEEFEALWVER